MQKTSLPLHVSTVENKFSVQDALDRIEKGIENINSNEEWIRFLSFQSRFPTYSFNNTLLIYFQKPDAQYVCGFNRWKEMSRYVIKGQKAIRILAPCLYKIGQEESEAPGSVQDIYIIKGFKVVNVFDISQTAGDDSNIPILVRGMDGDDLDAANIYNNLKANVIDIPAQETEKIAAKGCYDLDKKIITVKSSLSSVQKIKTLIHEYSHHLHHTSYFQGEDRQTSEIIAESAAYIVASYLKLDTSDYSISYIKSWCKDIKQIKSAGDKIQRISSDIINRINRTLDTASAENQESFNYQSA